MQAYVWFLEAEPGKHPVIKLNSWIRISGHSVIVGAFSGTRRNRAYGRSDPRQIALRLFWTSCDVFIHPATFAFCHGCVLPKPKCLAHCNQNSLFGFENSAVIRLTADPVVQRQIGSLRL